ncbi:MAG: bifunctional demethylmenaquinone methyltransferase/2-methoxy-6-polyprenyl-1,4-benzoquinol methylase UbiE [Opitutaceae bacterium]
MPDPIAVNSMFGRIAPRYDLANRVLSLGIDRWWRRRLVRGVTRCSPLIVVDLATGSGDVAFALARALPREARVLGLDFCQPMLDMANRKKPVTSTVASVEFGIGDGLNLPLDDDSVDALTLSFGLRNMADRGRALREIRRVLRPGTGTLHLLEFTQPQAWFRPFYRFYLIHILPTLAGWLTGDASAYDYLGDSIGTFPDRHRMAGEIREAGFSEVDHRIMTFGIVALHVARA